MDVLDQKQERKSGKEYDGRVRAAEGTRGGDD